MRRTSRMARPTMRTAWNMVLAANRLPGDVRAVRPSISSRVLPGVAILSVALLSTLAGCGGWVGHGDTYYARRSDRNDATYRFGQPGPGWEPLQQKGVQVAWFDASIPPP